MDNPDGVVVETPPPVEGVVPSGPADVDVDWSSCWVRGPSETCPSAADTICQVKPVTKSVTPTQTTNNPRFRIASMLFEAGLWEPHRDIKKTSTCSDQAIP